MRKKLLNLIPYAAFLTIDFYLLPLTIKNTGMAMLMMLFIIPTLAFACALVYGLRQGLDFLLPLTVIILFTPMIFIFYNISAWIYIIVYALIAIIGNGAGRFLCKKR